MAPQTDEFGTKVGLLAGLVARVRRPADHRAASSRSRSPPATTCGRSPAASCGGIARSPASALGSAGGVAVLVVGCRHRRRRDPGARRRRPGLDRGAEPRCRTTIDPATLPAITVGQDVIDFDHTLAGAGDAARSSSPWPRTSSSRTRRCSGATGASSPPSITATGWSRCRRDSGRAAIGRRPSSRTTGSTTSTCRSSCRSARRPG